MIQVQDLMDFCGELIGHQFWMRSDALKDGFHGSDQMRLVTRGIGRDPASEADRKDGPGNHSLRHLKIVLFCDLVVGAVDAPAQVS